MTSHMDLMFLINYIQVQEMEPPAAVNVSFVCLQVDPNDQRDHIEQSPDGGVLVQELATRIAADGGFALIADYGHTGDKTDTFRVSHN